MKLYTGYWLAYLLSLTSILYYTQHLNYRHGKSFLCHLLGRSHVNRKTNKEYLWDPTAVEVEYGSFAVLLGASCKLGWNEPWYTQIADFDFAYFMDRIWQCFKREIFTYCHRAIYSHFIMHWKSDLLFFLGLTQYLTSMFFESETMMENFFKKSSTKSKQPLAEKKKPQLWQSQQWKLTFNYSNLVSFHFSLLNQHAGLAFHIIVCNTTHCWDMISSL